MTVLQERFAETMFTRTPDGRLREGFIQAHSSPVRNLCPVVGSTIIEGNTIENNSADSNVGLGINSTVAGAEVMVRNNLIILQTGTNATGIQVQNAVVDIINNTIDGNSVYGLNIGGTSTVDARNNIVTNNGTGVNAPGGNHSGIQQCLEQPDSELRWRSDCRSRFDLQQPPLRQSTGRKLCTPVRITLDQHW